MKKGAIRKTVFAGVGYSLLLNAFLYIGQLTIARSLSREEYAEFIVVTNFIALLALFVDLGLTSLIVKFFTEASHAEGDRRHPDAGVILGTTLLLRSSLALVVILVVVGFGPMLGYSQQTVSLMMLFVVSLFISSRLLAVRAVGEAYLRGSGNYGAYMAYATLDAACFAVTVLAVHYYYTDILTMILIYTFCNAPGFILLFRKVYLDFKRKGIRVRVDLRILKQIFRAGVPLTLGSIFLTVHNTADPLLLDRLSTPFEVSAFGASLRVQAALMFLPTVFSSIIAPEVTRLLTLKQIESAQQLAFKAMRVLLILSSTMALGITALPNVTISLLFGEGLYSDIVPLIILLAWAFVGVSYSLFMIEVAVAEGKQWIPMIYMLLSMVISVALDLALIPDLGAYGAVLARFFSIIVASATVLLLSRTMRSIEQSRQHAFFLRFLFCLGIGLGIHAGARHLLLHELLDGVLTISGFLFVAFTSGLIDRHDIRSLMPQRLWRGQ